MENGQKDNYDEEIFMTMMTYLVKEEDEEFVEDESSIALNCWNCGVLLTEENRSEKDLDLCINCASYLS